MYLIFYTRYVIFLWPELDPINGRPKNDPAPAYTQTGGAWLKCDLI